MASSSTSLMGPKKPTKQPQVFINFCEELRKGFIAYLEHDMREANINVFIDELEVKGTDLNHRFVRIEESKVALAIFSEGYTNSKSCLNELVKIKECKDKDSLEVIPIFYKMERDVVRHLKGSFGDNFRTLKRYNEHKPIRNQKWEEALTSITKTRGIPLAEQSDRTYKEYINIIIEHVKKLLEKISIEEKSSREVINEGVFFVSARRLEITHAENPKHWTWSFIYDAESDTNIEIATLVNVYWLHIKGNFTKKLIPGTMYEVVFVVYIEDTACGWKEPVTLELELEHSDGSRSVQERSLCLEQYIDENWVDIKVGEFEAPKNIAAKIFFCLHQYVDSVMKKGLVVKGVAIRPMDK